MRPYYADATTTVYAGDCLDVLATLPDASVDAVCTDPPYGLEFMGKEWDQFKPASSRGAGAQFANGTVGGYVGKPMPRHGKRWTQRRCLDCGHVDGGASPCRCESPTWETTTEPGTPRFASTFQAWCELWTAECLRVLKPGGHLLAFGGTRTWHRLACAVEDAGFEVRDSIAWLYGSGFPKSLDVSKAITGTQMGHGGNSGALRRATMGDEYVESDRRGNRDGAGRRDTGMAGRTLPLTPDAETWQGWGTALKPAWESVVVARKPLPVLATIGSRLDALERSCKQPASGAAKSSAPTPHDSHEATTASAPASAATPREDEPARTTPTGAAAGSSAATDTSASESTAETCSNIVSSWRKCWADLCELTSTSTTGTTSSTTTDLTTLSSCLSQLTHPSTLLDPTSPDGLSSLAQVVDSLFAAAVLTSRATQTLTATGPATSPTPPTSRDAGGSHLGVITLARKPLGGGTVAANVLAHGTGALNVDGCRVAGAKPDTTRGASVNASSMAAPLGGQGRILDDGRGRWPANVVLDESQAEALDEQSGELTSGANPTRRGSDKFRDAYGEFAGQEECTPARGVDVGGASRFFYTAKADASERPYYFRPTCECEDAWPTPTPSAARVTGATTAPPSSSTSRSGRSITDGPSLPDTRSTTSTGTSSTTTPITSSPSPLPTTSASTPAANSATVNGGSPAAPAASSNGSVPLTGISVAKAGPSTAGAARVTSRGWSATSVCGECGAPTRREAHATVKPLALMRWLVRLVTPPGGVVLEPFAGSGTTVEACILEGFRCIAIEREADYLPLIVQRINRRRDPVQAVKGAGGDGGLFDLLGEATA